MIGVHCDQMQRYLDQGYVLVETRYHSDYDYVWLANPENTCLRRMRGWLSDDKQREQHGYCTLDKGHGGRCSTVTFSCDGCGKARRGRPHRQQEDAVFCFMCVEVRV